MLGIFRRQHAAPATRNADYQAGYQAGVLLGVSAAITLLDEVPPDEYPAELRRLQATLRGLQQPISPATADAC